LLVVDYFAFCIAKLLLLGIVEIKIIFLKSLCLLLFEKTHLNKTMPKIEITKTCSNYQKSPNRSSTIVGVKRYDSINPILVLDFKIF